MSTTVMARGRITTDTDMALLEMFTYPFMQRALLSGVLLALVLASLGIFVTLRKMAFFGDGIAHASLAGIAIALLAGVAPLPVALAWAIFVALLIYWLERRTRLPSDTLIGIFFTASMALGVVLMSFSRGFQPEIISFLFGSILSIRTLDAVVIALISFVILGWLAVSFRQLVFMSLSEESAKVSGIRVEPQKVLLYVALALATVLGVKMLGIILVSALLIIPPATARLLSGHFRSYVVLSLVLSEIFVILGLVLSFLYDLPSGAVIVLVGTAGFFLAAVANSLRR